LKLGLDDFEVRSSLLATLAHDFEANLLAFVQHADAGALEGADVNEHVLGTVVRLDEAEAFLGVEKFYGAGSHFSLLDRPWGMSGATQRA
jgi:hypothetical protein